MPSKRDKEEQLRPWQFSIRGIVFLSVFACLVLACYRERQLRQRAERRLNDVLSGSHLLLFEPAPLEQWLVGFGGVAVVGEVYVSGATGTLDQPRVHLQMLYDHGSNIISESDASVIELGAGKYEFAGNLRLDAEQPPTVGLCIIRAECFDGDVLIATGFAAMDVLAELP